MNKDNLHKVLKWLSDHFFFLIRVVVTLGCGKNKETNQPIDVSHNSKEE